MMNNKNNFFNKRSVKHGSLSILLIVAVVAIAVIINLFVGMVQDKGIIKKLDLTPNSLYSIGDISKGVVNGLKEDVIIYALFDSATINSIAFSQIKSVADQYGQSKHVTVKYVDPDLSPGLINSIDPTGLKNIQKQDFVVKCLKTKKIKVLTYAQLYNDVTDQTTGQVTSSSFIGEQNFTGAINYVTSEKTPVIYFTQGHKEPTVESDYSSLKTQLEANNYEVKTIDLLTNNKVPADAAILLVVSPQVDLAVAEKQLIKNYIGNGGNVVFLFDSLEANPKLTQFQDLLSNYNVSLDYDKIKENDLNRYLQSPYAVFIDAPQSDIVAQDFTPLLLLNSRSIKVLVNQKDYITVTPLAMTSSTAVGEQIGKSDGKNINGVMDVAVAVDYKGGSAPGKVLVMGNGQFVSDSASQVPYYQNGFNFFTTSLNWMMDKQDDIVINSKSLDPALITISSDAKANTIAILIIVVLPLIIFGFGIFVWLRRRHL